VFGVAAASDGKILAITSQNGGVLLWSLAPEGQPRALGVPITGAPVSEMTYTADGSTLYVAGDNALRIWNVTDPSHPRKLGPRIDLAGFGNVLETSLFGRQCPDSVARLRSPAAGCRLAISGSEGRIKIFNVIDLRNPELLADFPVRRGRAVNDMQFSEDGRLLVAGADDGDVSLWDVADPRRQPRRVGPPLTGHTAAVRDVEFDGAGRDRDVLATGGDDGSVRLWDVTDPRRPRSLAVLTDPRGPVNDVTFSNGGKALFAASDDGNVWGWDVSLPDRPTSLAPLVGHRGPVYDLNSIRSHNILATAGEDGTVRFWDVSDAHQPRQLGPVITLSDAVIDMSAARDKRRLATGSADHTIRLWDIEPILAEVPGDVVEQACARANGGLAEDEWKAYIPDVPYRRTC
jgi:WD40 repeat protein